MNTPWLLLDASTVLVFVAALLLGYLFVSKRKLNLPPGPLELPFLGNFYYILRQRRQKKKLFKALVEDRKKYGDVVHFRMLGQRTVYIQGPKAIHEAFVKSSDLTSYRPNWLKVIQNITKDGKGVAWQNGDEWKSMRKFVLQSLRDFGVGKTSLEEKIIAEVNAVTESLQKTAGKPTDIKELTSMMIANVIYGIVFNKRFDFEDPELHQIIKNLDTLFQNNGVSELSMPRWISKIFYPQLTKITEDTLAALVRIKSHVNKRIAEHEATFDPDNIRDFVDLYLKAKDDEETEYKAAYTAGNMFRVIMDLFIAGAETTSNTINWSILFMQEYPDIQERCKKEIKEKFGDRQINYSDRGSLPFIVATLFEIQRIANIAPFSVPHAVFEDITLCGYTIPRHSIIQANLYSANMDPDHWDQPQVFNPDRWLEGGKIKKNPAFMPFSVGPRMCLGESLAKMEMFLTFTNLLQRFTFQRGDLDVKHTFEPIFEQRTSAPLPYKTRTIPV